MLEEEPNFLPHDDQQHDMPQNEGGPPQLMEGPILTTGARKLMRFGLIFQVAPGVFGGTWVFSLLAITVALLDGVIEIILSTLAAGSLGYLFSISPLMLLMPAIVKAVGPLWQLSAALGAAAALVRCHFEIDTGTKYLQHWLGSTVRGDHA